MNLLQVCFSHVVISSSVLLITALKGVFSIESGGLLVTLVRLVHDEKQGPCQQLFNKRLTLVIEGKRLRHFVCLELRAQLPIVIYQNW